MKKSGRYKTSHLIEDQFEPGSRGRVPCLFAKDEEIITALSVVHAELMLIHPFREGNGRVGRLLAVLM
ncbi:MAG: Fic family protein, partial [Nitrospiraceae bacterium]|nr:Fic family protein [Nitrospiraceae bacterium]